MTMLSLLEAAEQVGKSKSTLWRASKRGELSVTKDEAGQILVDSSELFRVFQAKRSEPRLMPHDAAVNATHEANDTALRLAVAETKIEALHAMVEELQRARDAWQAQAERLALAAPIVARGPVATLAEPEARRSWLRWWFGLAGGGLKREASVRRGLLTARPFWKPSGERPTDQNVPVG